MFDGVDLITHIAHDAKPLLDLYTGPLGFTLTEHADLPQPESWRARWGVTRSGPLHAWVLGKPGSNGGWLRVVEDRSAPASRDLASISIAGPHALDFYVRDMSALHASMAADGARFRSPPQEYTLFGADFTVRECLLEAPLGLVHALVDYLPAQHRCVLSDDPAARVSEVAAVVQVVPDVDEALALLTGVLGASVYLDQTFSGPQIEQLMALPPGTQFRMALTRGPRRRNARLELIQQTPASASPCQPAPEPTLVLGCAVDDVDALHARLSDGRLGRAGELFQLDGPGEQGPSFGFRTSWGGVFEFFNRHALAGHHGGR